MDQENNSAPIVHVMDGFETTITLSGIRLTGKYGEDYIFEAFMPFTLTKTLAETLSQLIVSLERNAGRDILTMSNMKDVITKMKTELQDPKE